MGEVVTSIPRAPDLVTKVRRALASTVARGRRRLVAQADERAALLHTKPMIDKDGKVVHVTLVGNDYTRWLIGNVAAMPNEGLVLLARKHGILQVANDRGW